MYLSYFFWVLVINALITLVFYLNRNFFGLTRFFILGLAGVSIVITLAYPYLLTSLSGFWALLFCLSMAFAALGVFLFWANKQSSLVYAPTGEEEVLLGPEVLAQKSGNDLLQPEESDAQFLAETPPVAETLPVVEDLEKNSARALSSKQEDSFDPVVTETLDQSAQRILSLIEEIHPTVSADPGQEHLESEMVPSAENQELEYSISAGFDEKEQRNFAGALANFTQANALCRNPELSLLIILEMAIAYQELGRYPEAIQIITDYLDQDQAEINPSLLQEAQNNLTYLQSLYVLLQQVNTPDLPHERVSMLIKLKAGLPEVKV